MPSLQCLQAVCAQNGSPLPVDQQLRGPLQLQVLLLVLALFSDGLLVRHCVFLPVLFRVDDVRQAETPWPDS